MNHLEIYLCRHNDNIEPIRSINVQIDEIELVEKTNSRRLITTFTPNWVFESFKPFQSVFQTSIESIAAWHSHRRIVQFESMCRFVANGNFVFSAETRLQTSIYLQLEKQHPTISEWSAAHSSFFSYPINRDCSPNSLIKLEEIAVAIFTGSNREEIWKKNFKNEEELQYLLVYYQSFGNLEPTTQILKSYFSQNGAHIAKLQNEISERCKELLPMMEKYNKVLSNSSRMINKSWETGINTEWLNIQNNILVKYQVLTEEILNAIKIEGADLFKLSLDIQAHRHIYKNELDLTLAPVELERGKLIYKLDELTQIIWGDRFGALYGYSHYVHLALNPPLTPLAKLLFAFEPSQGSISLQSPFAWDQSTAAVLPHHEVNELVDRSIEREIKSFVITLFRFVYLKEITAEKATCLFSFRIKKIMLRILEEFQTGIAIKMTLKALNALVDHRHHHTQLTSPIRKTPERKKRISSNFKTLTPKTVNLAYKELFTNATSQSPQIKSLNDGPVSIDSGYWETIRGEMFNYSDESDCQDAGERINNVISHFNEVFQSKAVVYKSEIINYIRYMFTPTNQLNVDGAINAIQSTALTFARRSELDHDLTILILKAMLKGMEMQIQPQQPLSTESGLTLKVCECCKHVFKN